MQIDDVWEMKAEVHMSLSAGELYLHKFNN
jgi:hypothetical protein